jgi:hypothetical protein
VVGHLSLVDTRKLTKPPAWIRRSFNLGSEPHKGDLCLLCLTSERRLMRSSDTAPLPQDIVCLGIGASIDGVLMSEVVWLLTVRDALEVIKPQCIPRRAAPLI